MAKTEIDPYLSQGIIAYIGNKRRLLTLIGDAMRQASGGSLAGLNFTDLFSGSGIVSRYARTLGMKVSANDWEPYARVLARSALEPVPDDIVRLFGSPDGLETAVGALNALPPPDKTDQYLAKYYAPASMNPDDADYRSERLFYTRENALRLDAARNSIACGGHSDFSDLRSSLLLSSVIYQAATHVNTSGVFKSFHKGFGGHGRDALGRIMAPIEFKAPVVIDAPPGRVFCEDANVLVGRGGVSGTDIVYLDPPYNQHQYGSNYHLLNTLVHWDRIPEPMETGSDGALLRKAAIRADWRNTRSAYCYREPAEKAFSELMDALDAPLVLISYSTDGIIPFETLRARCEDYGRVKLAANPYVTYRGGRQSVRRQDRNLEFVLIVERGRRTHSRDRREVDRILINRRLQLLSKNLLRPDQLKEYGEVQHGTWKLSLSGGMLSLQTRYLVRIADLPDFNLLNDDDAGELARILEASRCRSRDEELEVLEKVWIDNPGECRELVKEIPRILRKMAHRKYQNAFRGHLKSIRSIGRSFPDEYERISTEIDSIEEQARLRFGG